jgi:integrase
MSRNTLSRRSQALRRLPPEQAPHALSVHEHPQNPQRELAQREAVRLLDVARDYAHKSHSPNTWRSYQSDWRIFERWCSRVELPPLPASASTVAMFIAAEAEQQRNPSTIARRLAAIRLLHQGARHPSPTESVEVTEVMRGIRREWNKPPLQKEAALDTVIKRMIDAVEPQSACGLRDRALLLVGFAGAFRRSELVALDVADLEFAEEGLRILIRRSKTDQEGEGRIIGVPRVTGSDYCPVQALRDWLTVADIDDGPVFRRMRRHDKVGATRLSDHSVALIVKRRATGAGLDEKKFSGHSLRRGFLTSAAKKRASIWKMAHQSGHKSLDVLRRYVENEEVFDDHAGADLLK